MEIIKSLGKYKWIIPLLTHLDGKTRSAVMDGYNNRHSFYKREGIDADMKSMAKCTNCPNMCRFDCPTLQLTKKETFAPANKARIALFMGMGRIPMDNLSAQNAVYMCCNCDACQSWCPMDLSTGEMLVTLRNEFDKANILPEAIIKKKEYLKANGSFYETNIFQEKAAEFDVNDEKPDVFYYMGCNSLKSRPELVKAHLEILKAAGIKVETKMADRVCCGSTIHRMGSTQTAIELGKKNAELLNKIKSKVIISDCPGCAKMLSETFANFDIKIKKDIFHSSEYFLKLIKEGKIKLKHPLNTTVAFHDPCILGRKSENGTNSNHDLLAMLPAVKKLPLMLEKKETRCCGYGGGFRVHHPTEADAIAQDRYNQLVEKKPDCIVSACPTCEQALHKAGDKPIKNISELILQAMKD